MPRDKLLLRGLRLFGRHGVHRAEQSLGQQFLVDVDVHADLSPACRSDNFRDALDYVRVFRVAKRVVEGPPRHLVERVAHDIASAVFVELPAARAVAVRVVKPHVAIPAALEGIGVEIFRERGDGERGDG